MDDDLRAERAELVSRAEIEARVRDGAAHLLQQPYVAAGAARAALERELLVASAHLHALHGRMDAIERHSDADAHDSACLRPRAIRAVHGIEDLNSGEVHLAQHSSLDDDTSLKTWIAPQEGLPAVDPQERISPPGDPQLTRTVRALAHVVVQSPSDARDQTTALLALASLFQTHAHLRTQVDPDTVLPTLLGSAGTAADASVRANAWRILRYLFDDGLLLHIAAQLAVPTRLYASRSLLREDSDAEREQALAWVRAVSAYMGSADERHAARTLLCDGVLRTLIAIAHEPDDVLYNAAIETLAELAVLDAALVADASGLQPLWRAACDSAADLAAPLVQCLLCLLDTPASRQYICPGMDLEVRASRAVLTQAVLVGFTGSPAKTMAYSDQRLHTTQTVFLQLLRSFDGLLYLCMNGRAALAAVVATMRMEDDRVGRRVLQALQCFLHDDRRPAPRRSTPDPHQHYQGLVLLLLLDVGLLDALVGIVQTSPQLRDTASGLLGTVQQFARRVLPQAAASRLAMFPQLLDLACDRDGHRGPVQLPGKTALASLRRIEERAPVDAANARGVDEYEQRRLREARLFATPVVDDAQFRTMLRDSMVLATRDHLAWNVSVITELVDGPLMNARRFDEAITSTKLIRRILSFYRPFSYRYSALRNTEQNQRWTSLGRRFFGVLLMHVEGIRLLSEDRFLAEVREALEQLASGVPDAILAPHRLHQTLVAGYVDILGVLSHNANALDLLENACIFTPLMALCELPEASPVVMPLVRALDYAPDAPTRCFLARALVAAPEPVRVTATVRVAQCLLRNQKPQTWAIALLLAQLHDTAPAVRMHALQSIQREAADAELLDAILEQRPALDTLGDEEDPLFLFALAHPHGFHALMHLGFVPRKAHAWSARLNLDYVAHAEAALADSATGVLPPHFYGQLAKTADGAAMPDIDRAEVTRRKAALWALGHIGASPFGFALLDEQLVVPQIAELAATAPILSIRATCFYAMGLLASAPAAAAVFPAHGWAAAQTPSGHALPYAFPLDLRSLTAVAAPPVAVPKPAGPALSPPGDPWTAQTVAGMASLSNPVVAANVKRALSRSRAQHRDAFSNASLVARTLFLLDHVTFRLQARRFLWELMDCADFSFARVEEMEKLWRQWLIPPPSPGSAKPPLQRPAERLTTTGAPRLYSVPVLPMAGSLLNHTADCIPPMRPPPRSKRRARARQADADAHVPAGSASRTAWPLHVAGFNGVAAEEDGK
ncbi:hypothetical protein MSPP1_000188 [Malassezia sp. CBS 17886]|nr:hypothetical protein MSPP1_000188 [Malassezia sp. CBS 17886]